MTQSIQLDLTGIDTLVDVFTTDSGINYEGVDVDQFVSKRSAAETLVKKYLSKYRLDTSESILSALKPLKIKNPIFDSKVTRENFDLAISRLLPINGTISNVLARVVYFKNNNFYSYLDLVYRKTMTGVEIINNSYPIKPSEIKENWNNDFYDQETVKGAELLQQDEKEKLVQVNEDTSLLDTFTVNYVDSISESNRKITALVPLCSNINSQDIFKINDITMESSDFDPEIDKQLKIIFRNVINSSTNGAFPSFLFANNDSKEIVPYNFKQNVNDIADFIVNNLDNRPFLLKRSADHTATYNTRMGTFTYKYLTKLIKNKIKDRIPDSPFLELINCKLPKFSNATNDLDFSTGKIIKVIEKINNEGQAKRFALIAINNHSLFMSFDQEHPDYEGIDKGNIILFRSKQVGQLGLKTIDYGFIIRQENSEYIEILKDHTDDLVKEYTRHINDIHAGHFYVSHLISSIRSKDYYSSASQPNQKVPISKIFQFLTTLNGTAYYNNGRYRDSFWLDFNHNFVLVNQDLELYNQVYRNLITSNKVTKAVTIHDPNIDLQVNIENEAKEKLLIFQKGLLRLASEGKSFSISMNDSQAIEFAEKQIKFGNQILKCSSMLTVLPKVKDEVKTKLAKVAELTHEKYGYNYIGYYNKLNKKFFKNILKLEDIDLKDFESYTHDYANGAWNLNKKKMEDFMVKIKQDIKKHNDIVKPYLELLDDESIKCFNKTLVPYIDKEITMPLFSLIDIGLKRDKVIEKKLLCKELGYNPDYFNNFELVNSNIDADSLSNTFLMVTNLSIDDIDFNIMVNKLINKLDFLFINQRYGYFDDHIRPNLPISTKVKLFEATIGNVDITLSVSKSNADVITWYLNGKRLRRDEVSAVVKRALCFNAQKDYNEFIEDISSMSLRARNLVAKGLDITIQNGSGKTATVLLEFERVNKVWYLIIRDTNQKKVRQLEIEGGVVKFANSLIKKDQNNNRYAKKRRFTSAGFMTLMAGVKDFTVKDAQNLIATGLRTINEAIARSRKLLEDTVKMVKAQYITHTYGTKTIKGYMVTGMTGSKYLVACNKETFEKSYNGTDKFAGVYSMPTLTKICIVDKSIDQNGFDIIVNRILALKNDAYIAESVTTLRPYVGQQ